jgi:hypothetical protein
MSSKTIAKFLAFVILIIAVMLAFSACDSIKPSSAEPAASGPFFPPKTIGKIANPDIVEASGLAASKCQPGVFWTHNDSGDDAFLFAINTAGENLGTWRVANSQNEDWEDIAAFKDSEGKCFVYIGDIGNNGGKHRVDAIYRVTEPTVSDSTRNTTKKNAPETQPAEVMNFDYPSKVHDAETLIVHPNSGDIYVLSKSRKDPSTVYKLSPNFGSNETQQATPIAEIKVPSIPFGLLTGGDAASDGRRVVLCDYLDGYELTLPSGDNNFDDIWKQTPIRIDLGPRDTGEAVAYSLDGNSIYATTEGKNAPIIEVRRK